MSKPIGSTLDSLFEETGELDELDLLRRKKILAEQIRKWMTQIHLTQVMLAKAMNTGSRRMRVPRCDRRAGDGDAKWDRSVCRAHD